MRKDETVRIALFAVLSILFVYWIRTNLAQFEPILEDSTLFFQLIVACTIIAILRNVGGVRTFGVFGPTIIAFGVVEAGLLWGLVLYVDIFIVVMLTAVIIYPLGIPSSHRIAILIIVAALAITVLELLGEFYHIGVLESAILFPVLITGWIADRYVAAVREVDWIEPSKRLLGTFGVTVLAVMVISNNGLMRTVALNPEIWLLLILVNAVVGLKVNLRISEYLRFKPITRQGGSRTDVMGMNNRNRDMVFDHNPRNLFTHMSKDRMKTTMHQLDIPTPRSYAIIQKKKEIPDAMTKLKDLESFVIKPSRGLGGEGIWVVDRTGPRSYRVGERKVDDDELHAHIVDIIDGGFTSEWEDVAIIEEKVVTDRRLKPYYSSGVPDIRVIVFEGFPVMAMTRLPTEESHGAANLHKGAIGMGLRIHDGRGLNPYWRGHGGHVDDHPDTGTRLTDLKVPNWGSILRTACLAQAASRLGYVGVDIVLDRKGPLVLEVNKRPGLEIQNTNLGGLLRRVRFVEKHLVEHGLDPVEERVALARKWDRRGWK